VPSPSLETAARSIGRHEALQLREAVQRHLNLMRRRVGMHRLDAEESLAVRTDVVLPTMYSLHLDKALVAAIIATEWAANLRCGQAVKE
jgi:hypothetical protein